MLTTEADGDALWAVRSRWTEMGRSYGAHGAGRGRAIFGPQGGTPKLISAKKIPTPSSFKEGLPYSKGNVSSSRSNGCQRLAWGAGAQTREGSARSIGAFSLLKEALWVARLGISSYR
jgi:hypothetical protein